MHKFLFKSFFPISVCLCLSLSALLLFTVGCETENNHLNINDLLNHFETCGLQIETIKPLRSEIIKAESGASVKISGREIGVYKYDLNKLKEREKIEKITEDGYVYVIGLKYPVKVNGSFILMDFEKNPSRDAIVKAFESFK